MAALTIEQLLALDPEVLKNRSPEDRIRVQEFLQEKRLYSGSLDAVIGTETRAALEIYRAESTNRLNIKMREQDAALKAAQSETTKIKAQQKLKETEAEIARIKAANAEAERKANEAAQAAKTKKETSATEYSESLQGILRNTGKTIGAPAVGLAYGTFRGGQINAAADAAQEAANKSMAEVAEARKMGFTTRQGAVAGAERAGVLPIKNSLARYVMRVAPHAIGAGKFYMLGAGVDYMKDPDDPQMTKDIKDAASAGFKGTAAGLAMRGFGYGLAPGVHADAGSAAVIESRNLRRKSLMPSASIDSGKVYEIQDRIDGLKKDFHRNKTGLKKLAKQRGLTQSGTAHDIASRIALQETSPGALKALPAPSKVAGAVGKVLKAVPPLMAGALAYDAATSSAEAAGGDERAQTATGATAAAGAAGAMYGLEKLAPGALNTVGRVMAPVGAALTGKFAYDVAKEAAEDPDAEARLEHQRRAFTQPGGYAAEASRVTETEAGDPDVANAWLKSPRRTVIELARQGLEADDIAYLAGVPVDEVTSISTKIPAQAMTAR